LQEVPEEKSKSFTSKIKGFFSSDKGKKETKTISQTAELKCDVIKTLLINEKELNRFVQ